MPRKPFRNYLPEDLRRELDNELVRRGFKDYYQIEEWLNLKLEQAGLEVRVSKTAINNYGKSFEEKLIMIETASRQAQAIVDAVEDDQGAMMEALTTLAQEKSFQVLMQMTASDIAETTDFTKLIRSISDLNRSGISVKKFAADTKAKLKAASKEITDTLKNAGVSPETQKRIDELLGAVL